VFDTRTRRHIFDGAFEYEANEALTFRGNVRNQARSGAIVFGGSFGHSASVEFPAPTEHNIADVNAGAEYTRGRLLLRGGYTGSWFSNDVTSILFDNPFRVTDISSAAAYGQLSMPPSNSQFGVNGLASVRLPYRTRVTAYASIGMLQDAGDPIMPQTVNTANAGVIAPLDRTTVEGEARLSSINLSFVSRPQRTLDFSARYRSYEYDNRTPPFTLTQRVGYDNAPAAVVPPVHTEPFGVLRHTFDADFRYIPRGRLSAGIGYTHQTEERSHRIYESTSDNQLRLTFDAITRELFSVRTKYEYGQRRGEGLDTELLVEIGEQPGMRHYDIASRDRNRFTVIGTVTPIEFLTGTLSVATGKDDYIESEFGLRDNTHQVYTAGVDVAATERVTFGLSYSFEDYDSLFRSRQANPGPQVTDPSRNWASDSSERVHSVILSAAVSRIADKVDLGFSYDFNRARGNYDYITGPVPDRTLPEEVEVPTTLPPPQELPPTLYELSRATTDITYALSSRLSVGLSYWFEDYNVEDFTLDIDANPQLVRGQAILLGYLYRPYTAHTGWVRLIYRW
jgi:MtrB/PioB family decaheme-associated outer membrane protein